MRAVLAGMVENGNSGPGRSGKFEIGAWLAERERERGRVSLLPSLSARQGCRIFPLISFSDSLPSPDPRRPPSCACCWSCAPYRLFPAD